MSECEWFNEVNDALEKKGVEVDLDDDGWMFLFENGLTPQQAVLEMFN